MKIWLIRHGMTAGNVQKRYIGKTDEPLCEEGIKQLSGNNYGRPQIVIASPMLRCRQSADILYKGIETVYCEQLRECDFGIFEGKNYMELSGNPQYQQWIDSNGTMAFPKGEDPQSFKRRSVQAFKNMLVQYSMADEVAFVVHGGTIMSVMEALAVPRQDYYSYQVKNGQGYVVETMQDGSLHILEKIV